MNLDECLDKIDEGIEKPFRLFIRTYENKHGQAHVAIKVIPAPFGIKDVDIIKSYMDKLDIDTNDWVYYGSKRGVGYINGTLHYTPEAFYTVNVFRENTLELAPRSLVKINEL